MRSVPEGFTDKVKALLDEAGIGNLAKADVLGQVVANMPGTCAGNSNQWMLGGLIFGHAIRTDAVGILKKVVSLTAENVNYNDMDCDLMGRHLVIPIECLLCSGIVARVIRPETSPKKEECPRCKGTGIDPEFTEQAWVLYHRNHGHASFYAVHENSGRTELHVRELPYNSSDKLVAKTMEDICAAIQKDCYDYDCPSLHYRDERDEGFVLSLSFDHPRSDWPEGVHQSHDCHVSLRAIAALDTVAEHFICVIESLEKGEEP